MPGLPPCPRRGSPGQGCRRSPAAVWARGARLSPGRPRPPLISMRLASVSSACTFLPPHSSGLTLPALPPPGRAGLGQARAADPGQKTSSEGARRAGAGGKGGNGTGGGGGGTGLLLPNQLCPRGSAGAGVRNNHLRGRAASRAGLPTARAPAPSGPGRLGTPATSSQPFGRLRGCRSNPPTPPPPAPRGAERREKGCRAGAAAPRREGRRPTHPLSANGPPAPRQVAQETLGRGRSGGRGGGGHGEGAPGKGRLTRRCREDFPSLPFRPR